MCVCTFNCAVSEFEPCRRRRHWTVQDWSCWSGMLLVLQRQQCKLSQQDTEPPCYQLRRRSPPAAAIENRCTNVTDIFLKAYLYQSASLSPSLPPSLFTLLSKTYTLVVAHNTDASSEQDNSAPLWCGQNCLVAPRGVAGWIKIGNSK